MQTDRDRKTERDRDGDRDRHRQTEIERQRRTERSETGRDCDKDTTADRLMGTWAKTYIVT